MSISDVIKRLEKGKKRIMGIIRYNKTDIDSMSAAMKKLKSDIEEWQDNYFKNDYDSKAEYIKCNFFTMPDILVKFCISNVTLDKWRGWHRALNFPEPFSVVVLCGRKYLWRIEDVIAWSNVMIGYGDNDNVYPGIVKKCQYFLDNYKTFNYKLEEHDKNE